MAKIPLGVEPRRARLSFDEMQRGKLRFEDLIGRLEEFDVNGVTSDSDPRIVALEKAIQTAVEKTYPVGSLQYEQAISAADLRSGLISLGCGIPLIDVIADVDESVVRATVVLQNAVSDLEEDLAIEQESRAVPAFATMPTSDGRSNPVGTDARSVFVVHGHETGARESVARFLEKKIGMNAIILQEQPGKNRTIIEKFEEESSAAGYAVVLMTPDDVGSSIKEKVERSRARQNVILELGYFLGRLGRGRVFALKQGDIEVPSDYDGVEYIELDDAGAWKQKLATELQAAGVDVDWNRIMK